MSIALQFLGGTGTVTGSKYLLEIANRRILVDCGLFQGWKQLRLRNWAALPVKPGDIDTVILTHAHLDHAGYLPILVRDGYRGRVHCTAGTADLCRILLPDSGRLLEEEANYANHRHSSKHDPAMPLYTEADAMASLDRLQPHPFDTVIDLGDGIALRFRPAGHILGAAIVELTVAGKRIVFSGDLGRPNDLIMKAPTAIHQADWLLVESTYGNRRHELEDPGVMLAEIIRKTVAQRGIVMIPSFAVGRAQSVLHLLNRLQASGEIPHVPVYLNSPMAEDATDIFVRHAGEHKLDQAQCAAMCRMAEFVRTPDESKALNLRHGPMIIVASSGMLTGGRILRHLKAFAADARNAIVFTGYQAGGTRGAAILGGADRVRIFGEDVPIRARVYNIPSFSAHADSSEILAWLRGFGAAPSQTFVVHGEADAADALRRSVQTDLGWRVSVPEYLQRTILEP